ncbi:Calpain A, putative, partial [Gryllus bimaculatus]
MKLSHFKRYFVMICVASPVPDFGDSFKTTPLNTYVLCNSWKSGRSAGGSNLEDEEFLKNPQYTLIVPKPDDQLQTLCESEKDIAPTCDVIIELIQENR